MSYVILKSNGTVLTTIPDGTINTSSTPLGLPGRLYPGYGQVIDTDVVHLLENFADSTPPNAALKGQLWYNTADSTLYIAPSDSPATNSWVAISTVGSNASFGNLTITGNITANNATISNSATANTITVNYATVNVSANITNANVTGNLIASNVLTNLVSTGSQLLAGNMIGTWTVSGGLDGNSLCVSDGNLYIANGGYGIKTDSYMYANGVAVSFEGTYTNSNVAAFLPVYTGDVGLVGGGANLNGDTLNTGSASNPGTIIGNWTVQAGSQLNGLSNIPGTSISSIVDSANTAIFTVNVLGTGQPNITSVGTLTSLAVSGTLTTGRIISTVSNGTAPLSVLSTTKVANLNADLLDNYNSAVTATPDTVAVRDSNGNITANYFVGNGSLLTGINTSVSNIINGTSNINIATPNGSIVASVNGVNNVLIIASSSMSVSGTLNATAFVGDGSGLTNLTVGNISGTIANANYAAYAGIVVNSSQPNITSVGTLTSLTVTGNINSGNVISSFFGSGAGLTNISGGNVVGTVSSATSATTAGTVTTAAQPNITSIGTLTSLAVTGNISGANLTGSHFGSGAALTNLPAANVIGKVANAVYADIAGASGPSDTANTVTNNAQPNITSVGTLVSLTSSGNITAANFSGNLSGNGFAISNINGSNVSGTVSLATTATTASTATTAGTVTTAAQPNITSVGTLTSLTVTGNISGANLTGSHFGNGSALSSITGANVTGNVGNALNAYAVAGANVSGQVANALVAGTVTTAAQPNITSVGILSGLNVAGTVNVTGAISATGNTSFASGTQQVRDIIEQINLVGSALTGAINVDLIGPSTSYYTVDATGNWVINFRGNSSVTANSYLATGQMSTTTLLATAGAIAYYPTAFTIDSVSVTPKWLNSAPVSGTPNKVTAYTFTIVKTGSAAYTVFASTSNYG